MMTEESTINPKSIAPKLINDADIPNANIALIANNIDRGIAIAVMSPARKEPRNKNKMRITNPPPSSKLRPTVVKARLINPSRS